QNFVRSHSRLALRDLGEIDFNSAAAAAGSFTSRTSQSGRAHVLNSGDRILGQKFETRLEQKFFFEGIADLDRRAIFSGFLGQFARCERRSGEAVATGF